MAEAEERSELDRALAHPIRAELVRQLWHLGEPASATDLHPPIEAAVAAGLSDEISVVTPPTVNYHLRTLDKAGVVEGQGASNAADGAARCANVIGGENAAEAVRRLKLS